MAIKRTLSSLVLAGASVFGASNAKSAEISNFNLYIEPQTAEEGVEAHPWAEITFIRDDPYSSFDSYDIEWNLYRNGIEIQSEKLGVDPLWADDSLLPDETFTFEYDSNIWINSSSMWEDFIPPTGNDTYQARVRDFSPDNENRNHFPTTYSNELNVTRIPESATLGLMGLGGLGVFLNRRRYARRYKQNQ
ncbi:MAG: PEP-CTERM sorting domain-containing protein [Candidatus Nanoarchaeia archaeon]